MRQRSPLRLGSDEGSSRRKESGLSLEVKVPAAKNLRRSSQGRTSFSHSTVWGPPGLTTFTGELTRLLKMDATAAAHDPVPEDSVSPAPRSKIRISISSRTDHSHQFHIGSMFELLQRADLRRVLLPSCSEFIHEGHKVWIPHRDGDPSNLSTGQVEPITRLQPRAPPSRS